jgi:hypothetical protein
MVINNIMLEVHYKIVQINNIKKEKAKTNSTYDLQVVMLFGS